MNKQTYAIIAVIAIVFVGAGFYISASSKNKKDVASESSMVPAENMMKNENKPDTKTMASEEEKMTSENTPESTDKMMDKSGTYQSYSTENIKLAQSQNNKVVLFFHAPWCPYCKAADKAFNENLAKIPSGVTVLKTDYDSNQDLKTKYGVTTQHTFIQIDNDGNKIASWVGGDIDSLIKYIK